MSSISQVHTACKDCVFAKYEEKTQINCVLDYISKYKEKNAEILEVYDEEKEFYVINNKKCIGYRENKWFEQYGLSEASVDEKISKFKELNHIDYLLVIDLNKFTKETLDKLKSTVSDCKIKPQKIIFIRYQSCKLFDYNVIQDFFDSTNLKCKWRIQTMVDDSLDPSDILRNIVNLNKGYRFILSITNFTSDINTLIEKCNTVVYEELGIVIAIKNTQGSAILFSASSYRWSLVVEKKNILKDEKNYIIV